MKAPMVFEMPPYPGYFSSYMAEQAQGHSLLNSQTASALGEGDKERLLKDMSVTAQALESDGDLTSAMWLRRESQRLK